MFWTDQNYEQMLTAQQQQGEQQQQQQQEEVGDGEQQQQKIGQQQPQQPDVDTFLQVCELNLNQQFIFKKRYTALETLNTEHTGKLKTA